MQPTYLRAVQVGRSKSFTRNAAAQDVDQTSSDGVTSNANPMEFEELSDIIKYAADATVEVTHTSVPAAVHGLVMLCHDTCGGIKGPQFRMCSCSQ